MQAHKLSLKNNNYRHMYLVAIRWYQSSGDILRTREKCHIVPTGSREKNLAEFHDTRSARADGFCMGSPRLVGGRKAGYSNMQEFLLHHNVFSVHEA